MKAGRRTSLAFALSLILFLPVAYAANTITLTSPNAQASGLFGSSVAVNEDRSIVVVGAFGESAGGIGNLPNHGHAYVLDTSTGLITTLASPDQTSEGEFGFSVAVSGTTVVVGAPAESLMAGRAYVFDATTGFLTTTLNPPNQGGSRNFGGSVAVSGTTAVVGARTGGTCACGEAYVFDATDGSRTNTLTSLNPVAGGDFGFSVAVSGTTVVVGAPGEQASGMDGAGNAYVFDATTGFLTPTPLTSPNPELDGKFGYSVSVSGTTVVVGTPSESTGIGLAGAGRAYVFDATTWSLATTLTSPYAQSNGRFGYSVAVSGTTVVVGASGETADGQSQAGHAYSFDASAGFLTTTLSSANPQAGGNFGSSVAVSCTTVVVSAPNESGGGYPTAGHAFIFS